VSVFGTVLQLKEETNHNFVILLLSWFCSHCAFPVWDITGSCGTRLTSQPCWMCSFWTKCTCFGIKYTSATGFYCCSLVKHLIDRTGHIFLTY